MNPDIHALSGAYAVDALDDLERARFEVHLADCAACREEVASLAETAGLLGSSVEAEPPAGLRDRVLADITTVRPLPPIVPTEESDELAVQPKSTGTKRHAVRRRRWPALVAAAAAVIALGTGVAVIQPWQDDTSQQQISVADQVIAAPDAAEQTIMLDGAEVKLVRSESVGHAVVVTKDMPPPPDGKVYELWLQDPTGTMVPAGLMPVTANTTKVLAGDAVTAKAAGITVEPEGGSPEPTSDPIAVFDFKDLA